MFARALLMLVPALVLALGAAGCDRLFGLDQVAEVPEAQLCFGSGALALCLDEAAASDLEISVGTSISIDTDTADCVAYTGGDPDLCVIATRTLLLDGLLLGRGSRPLVVVAATTATIGTGGKLDVSSNIFARGAGSGLDCVAGLSASGGGGGNGGSFGGRGGDGGGGNGSASNGGIASPAITPTRLRGGCVGEAGFGLGGGAVAILAGTSIAIDGAIDASGAPGLGGAANVTAGIGGGAGGSGGMIVLDAPALSVGPGGRVFANGGGGGEGGGYPEAGMSGAPVTDPTVAAAGGANGTPNGGDGGAGAFGTTPAGPGGTGTLKGGGGGGGGGAGVVRVSQPPLGGGTISPPPSP